MSLLAGGTETERREEAGRAAGCAAAGGAPAPAGLPCLTADKCIKPSIWGRCHSYSATARELRAVIGSFTSRWGFNQLGLMTLTFAGKELPLIGDVRGKWRSLRTNALDGRYLSWVAVLQRSPKGRLHFHIVVVCREDIRSGFDSEGVNSGDYSSASNYLRTEWAFWREACPKYGFGAWMELKPFWSTVEAGAAYVARYLARHYRSRWPQDKGRRLVSYAENAREGLKRYRVNVETGGPVERRLGGLIHDLGLSGIGELRVRLSRSWRRKLARLLDPDEVTERDFWRIVGEARCCLEGGMDLDQALQESMAAVTTEPTEWQVEL